VIRNRPGDKEWVVVARILGPRGNRGEVAAVSLSSRPDRFGELEEVFLFDRDGVGPVRLELENAWEHKGRMVLKFRGVDTISQAERWRGAEVRVPLAARPALPEGEYYFADLVGCEVFERLSGRRLGRIREVHEYGGPPLLDVEPEGGGELLIPFAASICVEIDPAGGRIIVELPEGLEDLNR